VLGRDHFQRSVVLPDYGLVLEAAGDLDGAKAPYRQSLAIQSNGLAGGSTTTSSKPRCTPAWPASS
jgi:hypothetical protein